MYRRFFSSTAASCREYFHVVRRRVKKPMQYGVGDSTALLPNRIAAVPPYPYGPAQLYKQGDRGLYGGRMVQYGNRISKKFSQKHSRTFHPNVQKTKLFSEVLGEKLQVKVVSSTLRTITKEGGLDNYLIKDSAARIKELGSFGWNLRYRVLKAMESKEQALNEVPHGYTASKRTLISDLFDALDPASNTHSLKQFQIKHENSSMNQLLELLEAHNVDTKKYKSSLPNLEASTE